MHFFHALMRSFRVKIYKPVTENQQWNELCEYICASPPLCVHMFELGSITLLWFNLERHALISIFKSSTFKQGEIIAVNYIPQVFLLIFFSWVRSEFLWQWFFMSFNDLSLTSSALNEASTLFSESVISITLINLVWVSKTPLGEDPKCLCVFMFPCYRAFYFCTSVCQIKVGRETFTRGISCDIVCLSPSAVPSCIVRRGVSCSLFTLTHTHTVKKKAVITRITHFNAHCLSQQQ